MKSLFLFFVMYVRYRSLSPNHTYRVLFHVTYFISSSTPQSALIDLREGARRCAMRILSIQQKCLGHSSCSSCQCSDLPRSTRHNVSYFSSAGEQQHGKHQIPMHHLPICKLTNFSKRVATQKRTSTQLRTQPLARDIHFMFYLQHASPTKHNQCPNHFVQCDRRIAQQFLTTFGNA